jgi:1-aminocyclopropane-1-carboxylate deaminase
MNADVIIPEGGSQQDALFGMQEMLDEINLADTSRPFDAILLPVGSGASMAGVIENCPSKLAKHIIGIGVLQGEGYLEGLVKQFLNKDTPHLPWHINHQFHFGGYAKSTAELDTFCKGVNQQQAKQDTPICIEPVYSGKCFFALKTLIQQGYFAPNSKILVIHTGGLQGDR